MKRNLLIMCLMTLIGIIAQAQTYKMTASAVEGEQGGTATLKVSLENTLPLRDFQLALRLPEGISIQKNSDDLYIVNMSERAKYHTGSVNFHDGTYSMTISNAQAVNIAAGSGTLFELPLELNAPVGVYGFSFYNVRGSQDTEGNICIDIPFADFGGTITVEPPIEIENYQFYAKKITIAQGETSATLNIGFKNPEEVSAFSFDIVFPDGIEATYDEDYEDYVIEYGDRIPSRNFNVYGELVDGLFHIDGATTRKTAVSVGDGTLMTLDITVNAAPGTYAISLTNQLVTLSDGTEVEPSDYTGSLIVEGPKSLNALTFSDTLNSTTNPANFVAKDDNGEWVANMITLIDGEPFESEHDFTAAQIEYIRTFTNTSWQPLYVPFNLEYSDWADKAEVAVLKGVKEYDEDGDGVDDHTSLVFDIVEFGEIEPNTPCIIKAYKVGNMTLGGIDKTVAASPEVDPSVSESSSDGTLFKITGIYQPKTDMASSGAYGLVNGVFMHAANDGVVLNPFRIYLTIGATAKLPAKLKVVIEKDGETTAVETIDMDTETAEGFIDLLGRRLEHPTNGIYIHNGKKIKITTK